MTAFVVAASAAPALAAGDVQVALSGRTLTLTGDDAANQIALTPGGKTDAVTVTPSAGTTLQGGGAAVTFEKVRNVVITMGAGDDRVDFTSLKLRGTVRVRMDDGNDQVYFTATQIRGRVAVRCGDGTDLVRTDGSAIFYGTFLVRGERGNDELQIVNSQFRNRLRVDGGNDDDHLLVQNVVCGALSRADLRAGPGLDLAEIVGGQFGNECFADMGGDDDRLRIVSCRFTLDVEAFGGDGLGDALSLEGVNVYGRLKTFDGFEEGQPLN